MFLIVCNGSVFCDGSVGAVDGVFAGAGIPTTAFFDGVPLCYSAFKGDARKVVAIPERGTADRGDRVADCDTFELRATIECIIANGGDGIANCYARKVVATKER